MRGFRCWQSPLQLDVIGGDSLCRLDAHKHSVYLTLCLLQAATVLCTCVFDGNMPLVKRYLAAGVPIDAGDYDLRTALHISAAEGNLTAVRSILLACPLYMG